MAGGVRLSVPRGGEVRPTADRVKESVFASLGDIRGWRVADLFAGSGALGLEACSRGARQLVLVESQPQCLHAIEENVSRVRRALGGQAVGVELQVVRADVRQVAGVLPALAGQLDLILADPPYQAEYGAEALLRDVAFAAWAAPAWLVLEHQTSTPLPWAPASQWQLLRQRRFGSTTVSFCRVLGTAP
jgi:16S rRNA (guanine966-N2)-methyltransferase